MIGERRPLAARLGAPVTLAVATALVCIHALLGSEREAATLFFAVHSSQLGEEGWFRLFTASAIHADFAHLFFNLVGLLFLGMLLEPRVGSARFACVLFGSALCAALITTGLSPRPSVGASGAVYGLLGALLAASRAIARATGQPPPSPGLLALVAVLVLSDNAREGIDHWAHAGGALGGAVLGLLSALQRATASTGLRASAVVLASVYGVAGAAGWVEYRLTETSAVVREWIALGEHAWRVATDAAASRRELERDRDRIRGVLEHARGERPSLLALRSDLRVRFADTLATLHHRLGEHAEAIGIERELAREDDDPFLVSQLARFEWAALHALPAPQQLAHVALERVDGRIDRLDLTLPEPRAAAWSVDVLCSAHGELVGLLRLSAGFAVDTPVRVSARAQWPPSGATLSPVYAAPTERSVAARQVEAQYWPLDSGVKGLP